MFYIKKSLKRITILLGLLIGISTMGLSEDKVTELLNALDTVSTDYSEYKIHLKLSHILIEDYNKAMYHAKTCYQLAKGMNDTSMLVRSYYSFASIEYKNHHYKAADKYYDKSYRLSLAIFDTTAILYSSYYRGDNYAVLGEYNKAVKWLTIALKWSRILDDAFEINGCLQRLAYIYTYMDEYALAIKCLDESYEIELKNDFDLSYSLYYMGLLYQQKGEYTKAKAFLAKCMAITKDEVNSTDYGSGLNFLGETHYLTGQYDSAMSYFLQYLEIADYNKEVEHQQVAYLNIATLQLELGELEKAIQTLDKIIVDAAVDFETYLNKLNLVCQIQLQQNDLKAARQTINKAFKVIEDIPVKTYQIKFHNLLGKLNIKERKYKTALNNHQVALKYAQSVGQKSGICLSLYHNAVVYQHLNDFENAYQAAKQSLDIAHETGFRKQINNLYKLLAEVTAAKGNHIAAYEYQLLFQAVQDSILNVEKQRSLIKFQTEFHVSEKEAENSSLKTQVSENQIIIQRRSLIGILLGVGLLFLLIIAGWLYYNNVQRRKNNQLLEQKVAERTKDLEQANYELRTFNYIASHDIKEPIRNIGSYVSLIRRKLPNDLKETLEDYFDFVKRNTTQLYTLIEDFAYYSTLSQDVVLELEPVDLNLLTNNVFESLEKTIHRYKGTVVFNDLPTIQSKNSLLFTALKNLIENGLKYNQSENPTVNIDYQKIADAHQIIVSDNGIGIEKQYHEKIFEMFKRLHNRGAYEGSGIGLAIVKLCVEKLGGTVQLESEEEKGSRFIIQLPI